MVLSANKPGYLVLTLFLLHEQMTINDKKLRGNVRKHKNLHLTLKLEVLEQSCEKRTLSVLQGGNLLFRMLQILLLIV